MKFSILAELNYTATEAEPCTFIFNIHAKGAPQQLEEEQFRVSVPHTLEEIPSYPDGNRLIRICTTAPGNITFSYKAVVATSYKIFSFENAAEAVVAEFPPSVLTYLYPSRYCQSDQLFRLAQRQFGAIENEFEKVLAVCDWIHRNVEYVSGSTNGETSALDTVTQQWGVCRDFAHLGIALCRALTIPARYCSVYATQLFPPDFHACFEAYLSGQWIVFDPTKLVPLNGLVKIATGRDAADTAIANLFGPVTGGNIAVSCIHLGTAIDPIFYEAGKWEGICYG